MERMESSQAENLLLKKKYDLHKSPEVESAARRTRTRTGEKVPQDPLVRIQNYLDRLDNIVNPSSLEGSSGFDRKERNLEMLKHRLYDKLVVKSGEIPENYWETQKRIIRERGQGADLGQVDFNELKRQNIEAIVTDQKSSLDNWLDYLSSQDAMYPNAFKYFALRSILSMGEYDKEKKVFTQRSKGTTKPFPDLNREALAYVLDAIEKKYKGKNVDLPSLEEKDQQQFEKLLQSENFAKLYAFAIEKVTPESAESLINTKGIWKKYNRDSDHMPLVQSLQGHATGWCTAGESVAQAQLKNGDFYVYYSFDKDGRPTIPRVAIRMEENNIGEIRGIAPEQNLDPYINPIVEEKLKEFPDRELYKKKISDMRLLTEIDNKTEKGQSLTGEDLLFLYETNNKIQGFGYQKDPRIEELRAKRDAESDMLIIFNCEKDQIAKNASEINENTKAYVGPLVNYDKNGKIIRIFDLFQKYHIEQVYTSFPEGKIKFDELTIGGKNKNELKKEIKENMNIYSYAEDILDSKNFTTLKSPESFATVRLRVEDLGFEKGHNPTTEEVYSRALELGLNLCPAEVGPHQRLKDINQPMNDWHFIAMKQITDRNGPPGVFALVHNVNGLWLRGAWARPDYKWRPEDEFMFGLSKPASPAGRQDPRKLSPLEKFFKH